MRSPLPHSVLSTAIVAVAFLGLTGCSIVSQASDAIQGKEDVFSMQVGDCTDDDALDATEVTGVKMVECDGPHDNEVYATVQLESTKYPLDSAYPGNEAMAEIADQSCLPYFETWVGSSVDDTTLYYFPYYPSEASWGQSDREVVCLAYDTEGPITGTLEGKGPEFPYPAP